MALVACEGPVGKPGEPGTQGEQGRARVTRGRQGTPGFTPVADQGRRALVITINKVDAVPTTIPVDNNDEPVEINLTDFGSRRHGTVRLQ